MPNILFPAGSTVDLPRLDVKKRKKFQIETVRDLLHENIDKPVDMEMITNKVKIRSSQVYNAFKKEYGITPKKYLQHLRFNAIKKELLLSDPNSITVSGIAKKYHFHQMGHFAAGYKQLFGETPSQTLHTKKRKKFQIETVRDLLHENIDKPVDMEMITNKVKIRSSQLYNAFKKEYGITPKKYLQVLRFNVIKKELLLSNPNSVTVSGIAKKYHFRQMGHFAAGYKQLFGETPSQTLHRKR